jgi:hypothetical protein
MVGALKIENDPLRLSVDTACWMGLAGRWVRRAYGPELDPTWLGFEPALAHVGRFLGSLSFDRVQDLNPVGANSLVLA